MREDKYMEMTPAAIDRKLIAADYIAKQMTIRMQELSHRANLQGWDDRIRESYRNCAESKAEAIELCELLDIVRAKRGGWTRFYVTPAGRKMHSRHNCAALVRAKNPEMVPELSGLPSWTFTWATGSHLCHYCQNADKRER